MRITLDNVLIWRNLSLARQRQLPVVIAALGSAGFLVVFLMLWGLTASADQEADALRGRLGKISPMVREILAAERQRPATVDSRTPLATAQAITREINLETHLTSVRPSQLSGGQEAVALVYESLDLSSFTRLLQALRDKGNLSVFSIALSHRLDDNSLADVHLVLAK